jgi:hypothetical protein
MREGGRKGFRQPGWLCDEGDTAARPGGHGLDHDGAGPLVTGGCRSGEQDRRGGSDPAIGGDELGDVLVHCERARAQARADAGDTREVAQRGQGAVFTVRAVHHRNDNVAAAEDADDVGQTW